MTSMATGNGERWSLPSGVEGCGLEPFGDVFSADTVFGRLRDSATECRCCRNSGSSIPLLLFAEEKQVWRSLQVAVARKLKPLNWPTGKVRILGRPGHRPPALSVVFEKLATLRHHHGSLRLCGPAVLGILDKKDAER